MALHDLAGDRAELTLVAPEPDGRSRFTSAPTSREVGARGGAALDCLWWPPHKISARYLAPFLYHGDVHVEPEPPRRPLEVEVALPREWHENPMSLDP